MRNKNNSIIGLDALRGFAIILMFITHGFRLYLSNINDFSQRVQSSSLDNFLNFFAVIEPFTSSLFLFIVGYSLFISHSKTKNENFWFKTNLIKSLKIYLIGMLLFFMEKGPQIPDLFLSPSILSCIAVAIILGSLVLKLKNNIFNIFLIISLLIFSYFIEGKYNISGLNGGFGGTLPLVVFTLMGIFMAKLTPEVHKLSKKWLLVVVPSLLAWLIPGDWTHKYSSVYYHFNTGETGIDFLKNLFIDYTPLIYDVKYWNHSVLAFFKLQAPLIIFLALFLKYGNQLKDKIYTKSLALLGRHALGNYVLHLSIIGVADFIQIKPENAQQAWLFIGFLILIALIFSKSQERKTI